MRRHIKHAARLNLRITVVALLPHCNPCSFMYGMRGSLLCCGTTVADLACAGELKPNRYHTTGAATTAAAPPGAPGAPRLTSAAGAASLQLAWDAAQPCGAPVTGYTLAMAACDATRSPPAPATPPQVRRSCYSAAHWAPPALCSLASNFPSFAAMCSGRRIAGWQPSSCLSSRLCQHPLPKWQNLNNKGFQIDCRATHPAVEGVYPLARLHRPLKVV